VDLGSNMIVYIWYERVYVYKRVRNARSFDVKLHDGFVVGDIIHQRALK
jgi:hypothetical protein